MNRRQLRSIVERLEAKYGAVDLRGRLDPMDELIACILSQNTSDTNSLPAFAALKRRFPTWEEVAQSSEGELAKVIKRAGLANRKAWSILQVLARIKASRGTYTIDHLSEISLPEALNWLEDLPGVGPKTASIVLCFAFGLPAIPVDTHVFRVGWRLGLFPKSIGANKAHIVLRNTVPPDLAMRLHVAFIQHGRGDCRAQSPRCAECPIASNCAFVSGPGQSGIGDPKATESKGTRNRIKSSDKK